MPFASGSGGSGGGGGGTKDVVREKRFAIDTGAAQTSATTIPASSRIITSQVEVVTPYDGGTTISVGRTGAPALLQSTAALDNDPTTAGLYDVPGDIDWGGAALVVLVTVGGAPAAGAGFVIVRYVEAPSA